MQNKIVYLFDETTKEYVGTEFAYQDPSGSDNIILPKNGTLNAPLPFKDGYRVIYDNDQWRYKTIEDVALNVDNSAENKEYKIAVLKNLLKDMDYKAVKCFMAYINEEPMPYDVKQVNQEMKAIRDKIHSLENSNG